MKKFMCLLSAVLFVFCALEAQVIRKYDIKSGIITLESVPKISGMEIKMTRIVYFDDYGIKRTRRNIFQRQTIRRGFYRRMIGISKIRISQDSPKVNPITQFDRQVFFKKTEKSAKN